MRYKFLVIGVTVAGTALGAVASRFFSPQYRAEAKIWIAAASAGSIAGPIAQGELVDTYAWIPLLRSREVLRTVVLERRLYLGVAGEHQAKLAGLTLGDSIRPGSYMLSVDNRGSNFTLRAVGEDVIQTGTLGEPIGQSVGLVWQPDAALFEPGEKIEFYVSTPSQAAVSLGGRLDAMIADRSGNFLDVALQGSDPENITLTLNAVADRFVDQAALLKKEQLVILTNVLQGQRETAERNLRIAEDALRRHQEATIALPSQPGTAGANADLGSALMTDYVQLNVDRRQYERDRRAIEQALSSMRNGAIPTEAIEVIPAVQNSTELQQLLNRLTTQRTQRRALLNRYTQDHPAVGTLSSEIETLENGNIPAGLRGLASELANREAEMQSMISSSSSELRQIPQRVIDGQRLVRDVEIQDQMYRSTEQRVQEARLAEVEAIPDVRVFDRAVPPQFPVANTGPLVVLGALAGSLALAILIAVLLDRMDSRVRYPDQVTQDLGLNILGAIPRVPGGRRGLRDADMDHVIEALRGIRLNLMHSDQTPGPLMLTITSPGSGDGKSFVSSNLALAFADAGQRTLLIDADVRRGQLHRLFGVSRKPGLTEVLTGREGRDVVIQHTEFDNLSFIACGTRTHSAPELLGSTTMSQLLTAARSSYDVILIDSPPMGAGIDPFALGTLTGRLMLVLRTGITDREMASAKLGVLSKLPVRVVGAVLNDVRSDGALGYYYGSYSYHLPGYEASDEDDFEFEEEDVVKAVEGGGAVIGEAAKGDEE
jgi:tyrosine-protein kinase Etk/Wzc